MREVLYDEDREDTSGATRPRSERRTDVVRVERRVDLRQSHTDHQEQFSIPIARNMSR